MASNFKTFKVNAVMNGYEGSFKLQHLKSKDVQEKEYNMSVCHENKIPSPENTIWDNSAKPRNAKQ